jgi:predicted protein tyrosine phosphatase
VFGSGSFGNQKVVAYSYSWNVEATSISRFCLPLSQVSKAADQHLLLCARTQNDRMKTRLKDVIANLYKPSLGRQAFALSRADAEQLPRLPSIAVISITAPKRPPAALDGFEHLLRLSFADVDFLNPDLSERAKEKIPAAFTVGHADQIRSFIAQLPDAITSVVVHCEGGFSRSCAVVLALHKLHGYRVDLEELEKANPSIVHVLLQSPTGKKKK